MSWLDKLLDTTIGDADATHKGVLKLTSDIGGTADAPTIAKLQANALDMTNFSNGVLQQLGGNTVKTVDPGTIQVAGMTLADIKAAALAGTKPPVEFLLDGDMSALASLPATFDPPKTVEANMTIVGVRLTRRTAGSSGTTRVDILVDGVSIFAGDGNKPQVTAAAGANATNKATTIATPAVAAGQCIEAELETIESGTPADIRVTVLFG